MIKRLFSGIQPTGNLHLGNYLGAIRSWVSFQAQFDSIFCIVDLHAITVPQDPVTLRAKIREVAALLLAAGIDPERASIFVQSQVSAHAELAWILTCFIPMGWLSRMTQFKEKSQTQRQQVSAGLFTYPALMAADILLYRSDVVPVGEDQKQHLELTRTVAARFNVRYGDLFTLPTPLISEQGARIMSLDDPAKKMSKSESRPGSAIYLLDSPEKIHTKLAKATTDPLRAIMYDEARPGIHNLLVIYELFTGLGKTAIEARFNGKGYAFLKRELADVIIEHLRPLQVRYQEISADPAYVENILAQGITKVRDLAEKMLTEVKSKVGLG